VEAMTMQPQEVERVEQAWVSISPRLFVPQNDDDLQRLVALLDDLIDTVGEDESHPLASLMDVVGVLIEKYEDDHVPELRA
jgi:HTH-type transcriptional regulator / antitoxin HigA